MRVVAVGLNHKTAPLAVRERATISKGNMDEALEELRLRVGKGVILSTCNRSEIYTIVPSVAQGMERLKTFFTSYHKLARRDLEPYLYTYSQRKAVSHLFRVTAGLDSLILGEAQILGQVRDAYSAASQRELTGGVLARLFHNALRVGKRARRETDIGRNALSVSRAAVELAKRDLGSLGDKKAMVIGLGDAGKMAARAMADAGVADIAVASRTYERTADMAGEMGWRPVHLNGLGEMLQGVDIAIFATGSPGYVLTPETLTSVAGGNGHSLFLVDIAVPRDIDPRVKTCPGVHLYDLDDLETVAETNRRQREQEAKKVEVIVEEEADKFMEWLRGLEVVPTVAAIREQAEGFRVRELSRLMKRLPDLDEANQQTVDAFSKALVKRLMYQPIAFLKEVQNPAYTQAARDLYGLGDGDEE